MERYSRSHLANRTLLHYLATHLAQERGATAEFLADLAEVDERKLYRPPGYESTYEYCVAVLHLSEDAALKRIRVARAARRYPAIFVAVAEGRLNLNAVVLLAPYLTPKTADELLAAAAHKRRSEIERLLAARFPRPDLPTLVRAIAPAPPCDQLAARPVGTPDDLQVGAPVALPEEQPVSVFAEPQLAARPVQVFANRAKVAPLSPERFGVQFTMSKRAHERLRYAQELLSHEIPAGDVAAVFERALEALIPQLERQKFAATDQPRPGQRHSAKDTRHIPARVKRAVWERDGGRCTFVSNTGHRCEARRLLEFDHVQEFARGGEATASGIRLRCRAHNQYEAERTFGAEFMRHKRLAAAEARTAARAVTFVATDGQREGIATAGRSVGATSGGSARTLVSMRDHGSAG